MKEYLENYFKEVKNDFNNISLNVKLVYLLSTLLLVLQHLSGWSWDFLVYSMNGEYLFEGGLFMEWLRPPVASMLLGFPQLVVSRSMAEVVFVVFVSTFFLYSSYRICQEYDLNLSYFYPILMMPATIYYGAINGTEMLSLAFAMLFLSELDRERSGIWLGLTFLSRYTYGIIIPLVLVQKDLKKSVKTLLVSAVPVSLWVFYNYIATGHPMKSFANYLGLNLFGRSIHDPLNPLNLFIIGLPASLFLFLFLKGELRNEIDFYSNEVLFVTGFAVLNLLLYFVSNPKPLRYLYPMVLPVAFFATKAIQVNDRFELSGYNVESKHLVVVFSAVSIIAASVIVVVNPLPSPQNFKDAAASAEGCMAQSNAWPMISYAGTPTLPVTQDGDLIVEKGYRIIDYGDGIYGGSADLPVIENGSFYTTYGNKSLCKELEPADKSWIETDLNINEGVNHTPESYLLSKIRGALTG